MKNEGEKMFLSAPEVAKILHVSRATVANKIKKGLINAKKIGGVYLIPREEIIGFISNSKEITESQKKEIEFAVKKIVQEYGDALRMLGKE